MDRSDLPIPDFDHLPVGSLTSRIRSLDADELATLIGWEEAHGARTPVLQVLRMRRDQLAAGSPLSDGDASAPAPEAPPAPAGGSAVGPATQGPKINPPSQGVPTNPAQPRT